MGYFYTRDYPDYKGKERKIRINGEAYNAFFPKTHSSVKAIVLETKDLNAGDDYANIRRWHSKLFVMKKGSNKWEMLYEGPTNNCEKYNLKGYFPLLFSLETAYFKNRFLKNEEISGLKKRLREIRENKGTSKKGSLEEISVS